MGTILLSHFDGSFSDDAGHTLTASNATINTTTPKFGTGCGDFTASSAANATVGGNPHDFNFGAAQFTVEAWAYFTSAPSSNGVYGVATQFGGSSNLGWFFGMVFGSLEFHYSTNGNDNNVPVSLAYTPALNTWIHLAVDRDASNVVRLYANGVVLASATVTAQFFASTQACLIGNDNNLSRAFPGRLDEVRMSFGAMYGGPFTPPTAPFVYIPPTPAAQMTQIVAEEWGAPNPAGQLTQIAVEEWTIGNPAGFMTQIAIEQWASVGGAGFFSARHV